MENYRRWDYTGSDGGGSDNDSVPHGEPYAGNLHVRFDEGAGAPYGGVPLYSTPHRRKMFITFAAVG